MIVDIKGSKLRVTAETAKEEMVLHLAFDYLKLILRDNGIDTLPLRFVDGRDKKAIASPPTL